MEHIKAYKYMSDHGYWPEDFVTEITVYPSTLQVIIVAKMANAWVEQVLVGNVTGMPPVVPPCSETYKE